MILVVFQLFEDIFDIFRRTVRSILIKQEGVGVTVNKRSKFY